MEPRLFVSFWNIALSNFPVGSFRRRVLPTAEARRLIHVARASEVLLCVAQQDLGAPYGDRARERRVFEFENGRVWKRFDFDVMDSLHARGYITDPKNHRESVHPTEEGMAIA